jgi:HD-like signal output (HDOD) protein
MDLSQRITLRPPKPRQATPLPLMRIESIKAALQKSEKRLEPLEQKAIRLFKQGKVDLPPVPRVASLLISILNQADAITPLSAVELVERQESSLTIWSEPTLQDCAELISIDPCLSATVLRYATSALHSRKRIRSLDQAILRLGLRETAEIALSLSTHALYDDQIRSAVKQVQVEHEVLWQRAAIVARSARDIAKLLKRGDPDLAYTSALFHGCGKALGLHLFAHLAEQNVQARNLSAEYRSMAAARIRSVITAHYLLAEGLPHEIITTCLDVDAPIDADVTDSTNVIRITLSLVNTLLKDGHEPPHNQERAYDAARTLGMSKKQLMQVRKLVFENQTHIKNIKGN